MVTAKVVLNHRSETGEGEGRAVTLTFNADYADGRNKEWAVATPALSLTMTVKGPVAERFEMGGRYTLGFTPEE